MGPRLFLSGIVAAVFDHVTVRASDRGASERFYDTVFGAIDIERTATGARYTEWNDFSIVAATAELPIAVERSTRQVPLDRT